MTRPLRLKPVRGSWLALSLGLGVSSGAFWWVLQRVPPVELWTQLRDANWFWAIPLFGALGLHFWLKVIRWSLLLRPLTPAPTRRLWAPTVLGYFANNLLPARLGELLRIHLGARCLGVRHLSILATLVVERVTDLLAIMSLFGCAVALGRDVGREFTALGMGTLAAALGILLALVIFRRLGNRWQLLRSHNRASKYLFTVWEGLEVLEHPRLLWGVAVTSVLQWLLSAVTIYCSFRAFGVSPSTTVTLTLLGVSTLAVMVPSVPGYLGVMQAAFVLVAAPLNLDEGLALSVSVFFHLLTWGSINMVGLFFLVRFGFALQDIDREAREAAEEMAQERAP